MDDSNEALIEAASRVRSRYLGPQETGLRPAISEVGPNKWSLVVH
jgi:hypothetical protein